jgi:hypothetical protein
MDTRNRTNWTFTRSGREQVTYLKSRSFRGAPRTYKERKILSTHWKAWTKRWDTSFEVQDLRWGNSKGPWYNTLSSFVNKRCTGTGIGCTVLYNHCENIWTVYCQHTSPKVYSIIVRYWNSTQAVICILEQYYTLKISHGGMFTILRILLYCHNISIEGCLLSMGKFRVWRSNALWCVDLRT